MIDCFGDKGTEDIFLTKNTKEARKVLPRPLHLIAKRKLNYLAIATQLRDLKAPPGNRLEALKGKLKPYHSIRINDQWRIIFQWVAGNAVSVTICDYH